MAFGAADLKLWTQVAGLMYTALALVIWSLLSGSSQPRAVRLWAVGATSLGIGLAIAPQVYGPQDAARVAVPLLVTLSLLLRVLALRDHMGWALRWRAAAVFLLLSTVGNLACMAADHTRLRFSFVSLVYGLGTASFAWHAVQVARHTQSRSAWLLAWTEGLLALALALRMVAVWFVPVPGELSATGWEILPLLLVLGITALYGNLGYLGLALDTARRSEVAATEARTAEAARRQAAERHAAALTQLLQQRDRLSAERRHLLHLLAHEIRQPLHTTNGGLQAAQQVLAGHDEPHVAEARRRITGARAVLGDVHSVLDNTLAAAVTLLGDVPLTLQEIELDVVVDLALADLDDARRARVHTERQTDLRSAELEPGLVRLALRNLLNNALRHAGPQARVTLRVAERTAPPALALSVLDDGPGLDPGLAESLRHALATPPAADDAAAGQRLGLRVVDEVARRHGGRLELSQPPGQGLCASLVLPLPG